MQRTIIDIQTERLTLRPFSAADASETFDEITPTQTRFMSFDPPPTRAAFENIWRSWLAAIADRSDLTFVIRERAGGSFIGLAGLHNTQSSEPELGIWVSERHHGHGYGGEAVRAVAAWGAATFGHHAFRYPVAVANYASRRIAEEMGGRVSIGTQN